MVVERIGQTVRCVQVSGAIPVIPITHHKLRLQLGDHEVAKLLAYQLTVGSITSNAAARDGRVVLWKKSDSPFEAAYAQYLSEDLVFLERFNYYWATEAGYVQNSIDRKFYFPDPVVLLRDPQLAVWATMTGMTVWFKLWYKPVEVSAEELARLMVQDHA